MPIYEYRCQECGAVFEKILSLHAEKKICCPKCDSTKTDKLISAGVGSIAGPPATSACRPRGGFS